MTAFGDPSPFESVRYGAEQQWRGIETGQSLLESQARLQAFEMERQFNARKLQEAMAIDVAEKSRLEVESAQLAIEAQRQQIAESQARMSHQYRQEDRLETRSTADIFFGAPEYWLGRGRVLKDGRIIKGSPDEVKAQREAMEAQREQEKESYEARRGAFASTYARDLGAITNSIRAEIGLLQDEYDSLEKSLLMVEGNEEQEQPVRARMEQIRAQQQALMEQLRQSRQGMAVPGGEGGEAPPGPQSGTGAPSAPPPLAGQPEASGRGTNLRQMIGQVIDTGASVSTPYVTYSQQLKQFFKEQDVPQNMHTMSRFLDYAEHEAQQLIELGWPPNDAVQQAVSRVLYGLYMGQPDVVRVIRGSK